MIYLTIGREKITSLSSAKALTLPATGVVYYAILQPATQAIRVTTDGSTTPTATVGISVSAGSVCEIWGLTDLTNTQIIEEAASASVEVVYMGIPA